jgi:hypothetical protein
MMSTGRVRTFLQGAVFAASAFAGATEVEPGDNLQEVFNKR